MVTKQKVRASRLQWIRIDDIVPSPYGQRDFIPSWAATLAAKFDLEKMGIPVLNLRDGVYYCVDGQHRLAALRDLGFGEDKVQCEVYEGLGPEEEADLFLARNYSKQVKAFDRFRASVTARHEEEAEIDRILRSEGLHLGRERSSGGVSAVTVLLKVYRKAGPEGLTKTLRILRDGYGFHGLGAPLIEGLGLVIHRYNGAIEEERLVKTLADTPGGLNAVLVPAHRYRAAGYPLAVSIAGSFVDLYNRGRGGKKIANWFKDN